MNLLLEQPHFGEAGVFAPVEMGFVGGAIPGEGEFAILEVTGRNGDVERFAHGDRLLGVADELAVDAEEEFAVAAHAHGVGGVGIEAFVYNGLGVVHGVLPGKTLAAKAFVPPPAGW